jgi:hypothetical protein
MPATKICHYCLALNLLLPAVAGSDPGPGIGASGSTGNYAGLVQLFQDWRDFESPGLLNGAPDYTTNNMEQMHLELKSYQQRLNSFEIGDWPLDHQVDWHLVRAEMNGLDFNIRVLRPWQRDPAYYASVWTYQSDTPAHEGSTHHALIELWTYTARDLWVAGIKNISDQAVALEDLAGRTGNSSDDFNVALKKATQTTLSFAAWLKEQAASKTGPSGVGKENYSWYLRNVHLVPLSWEEEVSLLKRELDRAHARLRLEEHRNRNLPPLQPISSAQEYDRRAEAAVVKFTEFLRTEKILPDYEYIEPVLRAHMGEFVPLESRNFFATAAHHEQLALWTHWYHWFDLARIVTDPHPSPMRSGPLLYNIFDSRSEGMATGFEEMMMHAGLFDDNPRAREIVYIMLAQRAARGLGSLYAQANIFTMQEARNFHVAWTPRGWMREDLDLLGFEQHLYLRQPGYGTSYVTGKYLLERLVAERGKQLKEDFSLLRFFRELDETGVIPVSLIRYQLTGKDDEIRQLLSD